MDARCMCRSVNSVLIVITSRIPLPVCPAAGNRLLRIPLEADKRFAAEKGAVTLAAKRVREPTRETGLRCELNRFEFELGSSTAASSARSPVLAGRFSAAESLGDRMLEACTFEACTFEACTFEAWDLRRLDPPRLGAENRGRSGLLRHGLAGPPLCVAITGLTNRDARRGLNGIAVDHRVRRFPVLLTA